MNDARAERARDPAIARLAAELAIGRLIAEYSQLCDDGRFEEFAELFLADARFEVMGVTHEGRDAIGAFLREAQPPAARGRHVTATPVIDLAADTLSADVVTDYLFVAPDRAATAPEATMYTRFSITSVGRYHDEVRVGDDGRWRFARRRIVFLPVG